MPVLSVDSLKKTYGKTTAVADVSFEVRRGEVFGLLGPNGAGKSTTIGSIAGVVQPDSGRVTLEGAGSPTQPQVRRNIGVAPQTLSIYEMLTGEENLLFFGRVYGLARPALRARCGELLEFAGLTDRRRDRARVYSGGMKRRLNLAIALMHSPPLLLLDEPTAGVDPQSRNAIFEMIERLRKGGTTIIYTTHYMEEAERLCDRIAIVDHGRVLTIGTLTELLDAHAGASVVTIKRSGRDAERIETTDPMKTIADAFANGGVTGLRVARPNLETVFLGLTGRGLRD